MKKERNTETEPILLRGEEVPQLLGVSRALAYRWMSAGVLPTVRIPGGRTVRVPLEALLAWVQSQTQTAGRTA